MVTLLFFKRDLNIPLLTLTSHLHLVPHERFSAITTNDHLGLFGLKGFRAVEILAEGDLHGVRA